MLKEVGIWNTNTERHDSTHVAKDGVLHIFFNLCHKLVGNNEVQAILTSLREDDGKVLGCVVLKLIDIQIEILALLKRNVLSTHGRGQDLGNQNETEEFGIFFTEFPFRKV